MSAQKQWPDSPVRRRFTGVEYEDGSTIETFSTPRWYDRWFSVVYVILAITVGVVSGHCARRAYAQTPPDKIAYVAYLVPKDRSHTILRCMIHEFRVTTDSVNVQGDCDK